MARLAVAVALAALIAVASAQAAPKAAAAAPVAATKGAAAAKPFAGRTAPGAFCRHSCYPLPKPTSTCKSVVDTKNATLAASKITYKLDGFSCSTKATTGCAVLILQSWPSEAVHDQYQTAEDTIPALVAMRKELPSTKPVGLVKKGLCATLKTPIV